jgi:hypothetical protein
MAAIDHLLKLAHQQGANEMRLGTGKAPAMFASGAPKPLTMHAMDGDTLRHVLGPLLNEEREQLLRRDGQLEFTHFVADAGTFHVTFTRRGLDRDGPLTFDGVFLLGGRGADGRSAPPTQPQPRAAGPQWSSSEAPTGVVEPLNGPATVAAPALRRDGSEPPVSVRSPDSVVTSVSDAELEAPAAREAPRALSLLTCTCCRARRRLCGSTASFVH